MVDTFAGFRYQQIAGVPVLWHEDPRFKTFHAAFHVVRPLDESAAARSVLPGLLLHGTTRDPDRPALVRRMEMLYGASVVPSTYKQGETHVLRLALDAVAGQHLPDRPDQLGEGLSFLADYLARPRLDDGGFPEDVFERERRMSIDDARSLIDDRARYAQRRAVEIACEGEPMALPDFGSIEALESMDRFAPEVARLDFLTSGPAWIVACGSLESDQVVDRLTRFLSDLPERKPEPIRDPVEVAPRATQRMAERVELQQARLVMVYRTGWTKDSDTWTARALGSSIFGGGSHSRLFREVREKQSLAYSASARLERRKGLMLVEMGVDEASAQAAEAETVAQLAAVRAGEFSDQELEIARAGILSSLTSVDDSAARMCAFASEQWVQGNDRTPQMAMERYASITREEIVASLDDVWLDTVFSLVPAGDVGGGS